jgi:hypothetical protein
MSQLTSLCLKSAKGSGPLEPFHMQAVDEVPLQVQQLTLTTVQQLEPLLQLQQLRELTMVGCVLHAVEMQRLTALASLTALSMWYGIEADGCSADLCWTAGSSSSCIWQQLPLVHLDLSFDYMGPRAVQALGLATQLTHLHISFCTVEATEQQLAAQLAKLQSLRQLWLDAMDLQPPEHDELPDSDGGSHEHVGQGDIDESSGSEVSTPLQPAAAETGRELLAVVPRLPALDYFALFGDVWTGAAVLELQGATHLTRLAISSRRFKRGIEDEVVISLLSSLTLLQDLELRLPLMTEACLPAVQALQSLQLLRVVSLNVPQLGDQFMNQWSK